MSFQKFFSLTILITSLFIALKSENTISTYAADSCGQLLGVYYGGEGFDINGLNKLEAWQQKKNAVVSLYTDFNPANKDDLFNTQLKNIWNNKSVPVIAWSPYTGNNTPNDIEVKIAKGDYDSYLKDWGARLRTYLKGNDGKMGTNDDRRVYIRLGSEMNGDWQPWSAPMGNNSPVDFQNAWKRVYNVVNPGNDKNHLQWIWTVNNTDEGAFKAEQYYPGDQYVDWLGVDGYNFGTTGYQTLWQNPNQVYDDMLARFRKLSPNKPVAINELASTTSPNGIDAKEKWITDTYSYVKTKNIKMAVWFNQDKETDWSIFGGKNGTETYQGIKTSKAYHLAVSQSNYLPPDIKNPKLLTDTQFIGNIPNCNSSSTPVKTFDSANLSVDQITPVKPVETLDNTAQSGSKMYSHTIRTGAPLKFYK